MEYGDQLGVSPLLHICCSDDIIVVNSNDHRAIHPMGDHVLVFSVKDQSSLVLSKYSITDGQLISTVS